MKPKTILLKLSGILLLIIFMNIIFLVFFHDIYTKIEFLSIIFIMNFFICLDVLIRPISREKDQYNRVIVVISFLSFPLLLILPYIERQLTCKFIPYFIIVFFYLYRIDFWINRRAYPFYQQDSIGEVRKHKSNHGRKAQACNAWNIQVYPESNIPGNAFTLRRIWYCFWWIYNDNCHWLFPLIYIYKANMHWREIIVRKIREGIYWV